MLHQSSMFIRWDGDGWIMYYEDLDTNADVIGWTDTREYTCAVYAEKGL